MLRSWSAPCAWKSINVFQCFVCLFPTIKNTQRQEFVLVIASGITLSFVYVRLSYQCRMALIETLLATVAANSGLS